MAEIAFPQTVRHWIARNADGTVLHEGYITPEQVVTTGQPILEDTDDINVHLATLATWADQFDPLPAAGEQLEVGEKYRFGDGIVEVRQSHARTEHDPATVPALFFVAREPGTEIDWIAGEQVSVGDLRSYEGVMYVCLQAHITEATWQPPNVPALWAVMEIEVEIGVWSLGVSYAVDDEVTHLTVLYRCRQAHTSQVGWEPPNVLSLWLPL